ncbi:MAG: hypothetical protein AAGD17_09460, partial [Bacteroidota bacterium]
FLLHWSSSFNGRMLSAMLHYGVRTFLLVLNLIQDLHETVYQIQKDAETSSAHGDKVACNGKGNRIVNKK